MQKIRNYLIHPHRILVLQIFLFISFFTILAFSRHDNFYSRRLDLGNMDQTVWNVLHGNGFTLTDPMGDRQESRLAVHADFLLVLLAPLYMIWSSPKMLLLVQVIIAGLGALPIYWIAHEKLRSEKIALIFSFIYLFYPPLGRMMLSDFHAVALSTTFLLYAFWFIEKKQYILFAVFALLSGLTKETVWLTVALMGIYIFFWKKFRIIGLITVIVSAAIFYYLFWIAIPAVSPVKQHFALVYLSAYGDSLNVVLKNMLLNPFSVIKTFFLPDRLYYYFQMLLPVGFLSLLSPLFLLFASESIVINTLSNNHLMRQIDYQYGSLIIPFIFVSAIYGYAVIIRLIRKQKKLLLLCLGIIFTISVYLFGEFPIGKSQWFWMFITPVPERQAMQRLEKTIDSTKTVSATNNIGSHFSQRQYLYNFPVKSDSSDYNVVYLGDPYAWPSGDEQRMQVRKLLNDPKFELIAQEGNLFAFKKK